MTTYFVGMTIYQMGFVGNTSSAIDWELMSKDDWAQTIDDLTYATVVLEFCSRIIWHP
jgi:hypothetical protein